MGLFKKFVIADALAWIALNDVFAQEVKSPAWTWVLLYSYSLRIYFDFSGYTDIAIGLGRLLGIRLPENFASPYLKPNLTQFWNSWHMTLTQWFRSYFFNPFTRAMRSGKQPVRAVLVILVAQIVTMVLIGLWHGVTVGFILWGLWHGAGLFIQNRWSDYMKVHTPAWGKVGAGQMVLKYSGIFLTFHFVSLLAVLPIPLGKGKLWISCLVLYESDINPLRLVAKAVCLLSLSIFCTLCLTVISKFQPIMFCFRADALTLASSFSVMVDRLDK
jgi:D-alanyl-lipoteichoic acid acyltransferase DltB (MBOAT superfamily)